MGLVATAFNSGVEGSVLVACGLGCSVACGVFTDQGSSPCPPRWWVDSHPLCHQESPGGVSVMPGL